MIPTGDDQPLRNASEGFIRLHYVDKLQKLAEWTIPSLQCIEHNANDGLRTSTEGLQHSVLVKVPVALMDKAGEYRFVISAKDSHADREKGHRQKWALERNQKPSQGQELHVWIDGLNGSELQNKIDWNYVANVFSTVAGIGGFLHTETTTAGPERTISFGARWTNIKYYDLSPQQQKQSKSRTIIVTITSQAYSGVFAESFGRTHQPNENAPPTDPAVIVMNQNAFGNITDIDGTQERWVWTNVLVHELTHVCHRKDNHCPNSVNTCVWLDRVNSNFYGDMRTHAVVMPKRQNPPVTFANGTKGAWSPWHSLAEINEMRKNMGG